MMQLIVLQTLTALLPVIGPLLPGFLKSDGFSPQANSLIAYVVLLLIAVVQAWAAGSIGLNFYEDGILVMGVMGALLAGPLKGLDQYLQANVGIMSRA